MGETRIKARRYRIFQLSTHDCMTEDERVLYDKYDECKNPSEKRILRKLFENTVLFSTLNDAPFFTLNGTVSA